MIMLADVLAWLPAKTRAQCVLRMPQRWIEENFETCGVSLVDIFYQRTSALDFLERVLCPEDNDMWDHISTWYTLTEAFCTRNVDWLNFHELVYSQTLSRKFYLQHADRFDWIPTLDREHMFQQFYENLPKNNADDG